MRRLWWFGIMLGPGLAWASEPVHGCFRSPAEAALMGADGVSGTGGFRVEGVRRDVLLGRSWAVVRSCEHPERPAVVVEMLRLAGNGALAEMSGLPGRGRLRAREAAAGSQAVWPTEKQAAARAETPVLVAGATVQVVRMEQNVRLTMAAVAQRSAAMGERVRLRVVREAGESEQFVEGVVRGAGLVEMEDGR